MGQPPRPEKAPSHFTAPIEFIVAKVSAAEPLIDQQFIEQLILEIADTRPKQRELAIGLFEYPSLLTAGRPEGPIYAQVLIARLKDSGAQNVQLPACARCARPGLLPRHRDDGQRICESCADYITKQQKRGPCDRCGTVRPLVLLTIDGARICAVCSVPERSRSHVAEIMRLLEDEKTTLTTECIAQAVNQALPNSNQQRNVYRELLADDTLLRTNPARGSHRVVVLAETLISLGAKTIAVPTCTSCGSAGSIRWKGPSGRCCRSCYESGRGTECSRCGEMALVFSRSYDGQPLCSSCSREVEYNHEPCSDCGELKLIVHRDDARALCKACWRGYEAQCSICGKIRPCHFADSETPRCEHCSRRREQCSICGVERIVNTRTADGRPLCPECARRREHCHRCNNEAPVKARTEDGEPLCGTCWNKDPRSFDDCRTCGSHGRLRNELCVRCAATASLEEFLRDGDGVPYPNADGIRDAFASADPACLLEWLKRSSGAVVLNSLIRRPQPITHDLLDEFWPDRTVHAFRAVLIAGGALPPRDEQLANFEQWFRHLRNTIADDADRAVLVNYANWQITRRLRDKASHGPVSYHAVAYARRQTLHVSRFLAWLREEGIALEVLSQSDLDTYLAGEPEARLPLRTFTQWLRKSRGQKGLEVPLPGQARPLTGIAEDERWNLVNQLLHDEAISLTDRLVGLLVLLYAQRLCAVVSLKISAVYEEDGKTLIALGDTPSSFRNRSLRSLGPS